MSEKRSKPDQYQLRFPPGLRDRLKLAADSRGRSMNAEIIARLEGSFRGWPKTTLSDDLFERVRKAAFEKRRAMEKEIEAFTVKVVERELPASHELYQEAWHAFQRMMASVPVDDRKHLQEQFIELSNDVRKAATQAPSE